MAIGIPYFAVMTTVLSQNVNKTLEKFRNKFNLSCGTLASFYVIVGSIVIILIPARTFMAVEGIKIYSISTNIFICTVLGIYKQQFT